MHFTLVLLLLHTSSSVPSTIDHFDAISALQAGQFSSLETHFASVQANFERGSISENELVDAYSLAYPKDGMRTGQFDKWVEKYPNSYYSHLARGIYNEKLGEFMRGSEYASKTPPSGLAAMAALQTSAFKDLKISLNLNPRPYLSILHLLNIANWQGDDKAADDYLAMGNRLFPQNSRIRMRYLIHLEPRWGGSYPAMQSFIERSRTEGAGKKFIAGMEAIEYQDMGCASWESRNLAVAKKQFQQALEFGRKSSTGFVESNLQCAERFFSEKPADR